MFLEECDLHNVIFPFLLLSAVLPGEWRQPPRLLGGIHLRQPAILFLTGNRLHPVFSLRTAQQSNTQIKRSKANVERTRAVRSTKPVPPHLPSVGLACLCTLVRNKRGCHSGRVSQLVITEKTAQSQQPAPTVISHVGIKVCKEVLKNRDSALQVSAVSAKGGQGLRRTYSAEFTYVRECTLHTRRFAQPYSFTSVCAF